MALGGLGASIGSFLGGGGGGGVSGSLGYGKQKSTTRGSETTDRTLVAFDTESKQVLDELLQTLTNRLGTQLESPEFDREAAIADAQGLVQAVLTQSAQQAFPQIANMQNVAGAYNATTQQQLRDQAVAEASVRAGGLVAENIARYADINLRQQQQLLSGVLGTLDLERQAYQRETGTTFAESFSRGTSVNAGLGFSSGGK